MLVDDHELVRRGLRALLDEQPDLHVVAEASDGLEAIARAHETKPDVVVMDVSMPGMNGLEATRRIVRELPAIYVLCLLSRSEGFIRDALCGGASGCILKECTLDELYQAIRTIARGRSFLSPDVASQVLHEYRTGNDNERHGDHSLTSREREVLQLIAEGEPTTEIAHRLNISVKTVATHREHLMQKLCIHSLAGLTKYAIREGLTSLDF